MSQQSLFDDDKTLDEHRQEHPQNIGRHTLPEEKGRKKARDEATSDVGDYIRRKDRQEMKERQERNDMHMQAVQSADKVALLRWALNAEDAKKRLDDEQAYREAMRCKGRMDTFQQALQSDHPDRTLCEEGWPFDDDAQQIPTIYDDAADYEGYLAARWAERWRLIIPTDVLEEAQSADPSFL